MKQMTFLGALLLSACVTINIYFPAAAAEKVADEIIQEIQQEKKDQGQQPQSGLTGKQVGFYRGLDRILDFVISPARAEANLSLESPDIRRLQAAMQSRFGQLKPFYDSGVIGIKADGMLAAKGAVALKDKNKVDKLIAAENADRIKLYQAIANANGHPEWFNQIKDTFAARWVGNAHSGWWYQTSNGSWKQK